MSSPRALTLGGFVGVNRQVGGNLRLVPKMPSGWDGGLGIASGIEDRAQQDGAWDGAGAFGRRVVGIEGFVSQPSHAQACAVLAELTALHPRNLYELAIDDGEVTRTALVRVTRAVVPTWVNNVSFQYEIEVTAPDPIRYGPALFASAALEGAVGTGRVWPRVWPRDWGVPAGTAPGAITLPNAGDTDYWPRLRIDGPVPNPVVTLNETGDFVRYNGTLTANQWLDIDLGLRRVLLNGQVSVMPKVSFSGNWLAVPAGGGSLSWSADAAEPAALLSVWHYESAWN